MTPRLCVHCATPLPATAHPNRRHCKDKPCKQHAYEARYTKRNRMSRKTVRYWTGTK